MDVQVNTVNNHSVEVVLNDNAKVLFAYNIPVAAYVKGVYYKTNKSVPPHVHKVVNAWAENPVKKTQVFFDNFLARK